MNTTTMRSPYLANPRRLSDVLAAIQVMGTYEWSSSEEPDWQKRLGDPVSADNWKTIFTEHPEFFRISGKWNSLCWRHAYHRNFSIPQRRELTPAEIADLSDEEKEKLTRKPLTPEQVEALMKTAIELHNRSIAHAQENRWLSPLLFALLGVILSGAFQVAVAVLKPQ